MQLFVLCIVNMCHVDFTVRKIRQNGNEGIFSKIKCLSVRSSEVKSLEYEIINYHTYCISPFLLHPLGDFGVTKPHF